MPNDIPTTQNLPSQTKYLRAQRHSYIVAKRLLTLQFALTVALPVLAAVSVFIWPDLKRTAAVTALAVLIIDATILERAQRTARKKAAKIQEEFDCAVLELAWDRFTVGDRPDPESIHESATAYKDEKDAPVENWYPVVVGQLPLHLARIVCQRTNLIYDSRLRRRFGTIALSISIAISVSLFVVGVALKLTLEDLFLNVAMPVAPIILWGFKEHLRQKEAAEASEHLKKQAQSLWENVRAGTCTSEECTAESRLLQNAIFDRRSNAPTIFNWIYKVMRKNLEDQMAFGAEKMVAELQGPGSSSRP